MHYWPLSVIRTSPLLPADCAAELDALYCTLQMSPRAFQACGFVVRDTQPVVQDGLIVMEGDSSTPKLIYTKHPTQQQWERLERANVIRGPSGRDHFIFLIEPLQ